MGRKQVIELFKRLDQVYPQAQHIYLVLSNWSIHSHPEVVAALGQMPRLEPIWLPTYARLSQPH